MGKYIFVTGGVCSSLGKGIAAASIGTLLEGHGIKICLVKIDPYLNLDAGTMNPYQHGEVYVTDDGAETDLDLGNYFRFTSSPVGQRNSITTGQVYQEVISRERKGSYLGHTVQVIPHITDEIKRRILHASDENEAEVTIVEVGGTVGDIESVPFLEAARQLRHDLGDDDTLFVHLTLVPLVGGEELKTKPTQHSVKELREIGIQADILLCRASRMLNKELKRKISLFTNVDGDSIISDYDTKSTLYEVPLIFFRQGLQQLVFRKLNLNPGEEKMDEWHTLVRSIQHTRRVTRIAMVGKYTELADSYKSITEALEHGGFANRSRVEIVRIDSENLESLDALDEVFDNMTGILIPGGFGKRGIEGMIRSVEYSRVNKIPYLGICLGMQVMVIEFARNMANLKEANSTEFNPQTPSPVVSLLEEQRGMEEYGGTMHLGRQEVVLRSGTIIRGCYESDRIYERHRHRYEISSEYRELLESAGLTVSAVTPKMELVASVQWKNHPWGVGVQFHPEFTSQPLKPHPLFASFISACIRQ